MGSRLITIFIGRRYLVNSRGGRNGIKEKVKRFGLSMPRRCFLRSPPSTPPPTPVSFLLQVDSQLMSMNMQM